MLILVTTLILFFSFLGLVLIFLRNFKKVLTIVEFKQENYFSKLKQKIIEFNPFKKFSLELFLQKILTKIRILSLKIDYLTFNWLRKLREKYQEKKKKEKDAYWEEVKKAKESKIKKKFKDFKL